MVILRDQAEESPTASATTYIMMAEIKVWGYVTEKEIKVRSEDRRSEIEDTKVKRLPYVK